MKCYKVWDLFQYDKEWEESVKQESMHWGWIMCTWDLIVLISLHFYVFDFFNNKMLKNISYSLGTSQQILVSHRQA